MRFLENFKQKWHIKSNRDIVVVFIVFAINGSLSAKISEFLMQHLGLSQHNLHWVFYYFLFIVLVLPIYPFMLMVFGYLFGQANFFFPFSKQLLRKIGLGFIFKK